MRFTSILFCCLVLVTFKAAAQEERHVYVRDYLYVALRETPPDGPILINGMRSGTDLVVLEEQGGFTRVRTTDGTVGWVDSQYLSNQPAARDQLEEALEELESLRAERDELAATLSVLEIPEDGSAGENSGYSSLEELLAEVQRLRQEVAGTRSLADRNEGLMAENARLADELQTAEVKANTLEEVERKNYFIHGAIAVVIGVLIAVIVPALKPKKRSEWA